MLVMMLTAFSTAWGKQNMKVMFAVFASFELVKDTIRKWTETLGTYKTFWMVEFTIGVDYFRFWFKTVVTSGTCHALHVDNTWKWWHGLTR